MNDHFRKDCEYHQAVAGEYDRIINDPRAVIHEHRFAKVAPHVKAGEHMVDLGCGTGHLTFRFGDRFKAVTAVDHSDAMLDQGRRIAAERGMAHVNFVKDDAFQYLRNEQPERFDFACCVGFLHHLLPDHLREIAGLIPRVLKPCAVLLISEPVSAKHRPILIRAWNRFSVAMKLRYSFEHEPPDEAAIEPDLLRNVFSKDFAVEMQYRQWEIFPRHLPPTLLDRLVVDALNGVYGRAGNVLTLVLRKR